MIGIDILEWPGVNQAFLASLIGSFVLSLAIIPYGKYRPVGKKASWGEAMLAATYIFWVFFLAYGIMPHQWMDHADKNLGWSRDKALIGWGGFLQSQEAGGWFPFNLTYEAVRDTMVIVLHAIFFGLHIYLAVWWQKRGDVKQKELPTSSYGRPLVKKA
ncbi:MAG: hypothetical protein AAF945_02880 [Actinomycetota bacterium]